MTKSPAEEPLDGGWTKRTQHDRSDSATNLRIVEATRRVIEDVGYEKATVERIARAAETSRPTFYVYFRSRQHVFHTLAEIFIHDAISIIQMRGITASPPEVIRHSIKAMLEHFSSNAKLCAAIEQQAAVDDHVGSLWNDFRIRQIRYSETFIADLQEKGLADPDADPYAASECLTLLILHFSREWESGSAEQHSAIIDRLVYLYHRLTGYALPSVDSAGRQQGHSTAKVTST